MSDFTDTDFDCSLDRAGVDPAGVSSVLAAWGINGDFGEWDGGFVLSMTDGRFAYVWGGCDSTGWGCQDGAEVKWFESRPELADLKPDSKYGAQPPFPWHENPADLNLWLEKVKRDGARCRY